uniref:Vicilin n=2 Tax=Vicia faba TaxID=3906 RepID=VCL_VICFA|nr:RecName: Full=Vicilin; Flags: Precursor [Vicia faba]AFH56916.1 vicilin [Vicia faba]CAA68559.1 vicilin [Vicia faba var. minor]
MAATTLKDSFPLLTLLGIAFLASVCLSSRSDQDNPFVFESNRFQTLFENENGHIRLLQKFDQHSKLLENLQNYRLLEYKSKPHTIFLPQQTDADFILVVLSGKAILTVLLPNDRNSFSLERGDTIKLPAGTIGYLVNRDDEEDLRVLDLVIPVNRPGEPQSFLLSGNQNQPSILSGFSKNILEASFNTDYKEIEKVLLEEHGKEKYHRRGLKDRRQRGQEENVIVKISRKQIEELNKNAKSSSKKSTSSESEPFNLRSREPIYSNKFGKFFEITPKRNPQLQDLNIFVNYVEINEGSLLLPHYNSRAIVIVTVNEGKGDFELVGQRNENQQGLREEYDEEKEQGEEEIRKQVQNYKAKLSPGDVLVIPAGYPVAIKASSNLNLVGFGINAENNQRYFLAGEEDNVISQIHKPVKELAFPGSAQEVDTLLENQKQSHFANAQPRERERGSQEIKDHLYSILGSF